MRQEKRFAGEHSFAGIEQLAENTLFRLGTVTHTRLKTDSLIDVIHRTRFRYNFLSRVEFNFHHLHVITDNLVIHLMTTH